MSWDGLEPLMGTSELCESEAIPQRHAARTGRLDETRPRPREEKRPVVLEKLPQRKVKPIRRTTVLHDPDFCTGSPLFRWD